MSKDLNGIKENIQFYHKFKDLKKAKKFFNNYKKNGGRLSYYKIIKNVSQVL